MLKTIEIKSIENSVVRTLFEMAANLGLSGLSLLFFIFTQNLLFLGISLTLFVCFLCGWYHLTKAYQVYTLAKEFGPKMSQAWKSSSEVQKSRFLRGVKASSDLSNLLYLIEENKNIS